MSGLIAIFAGFLAIALGLAWLLTARRARGLRDGLAGARAELASRDQHEGELRDAQARAHAEQVTQIQQASERNLELVRAERDEFERRMQAHADTALRGAVEQLQKISAEVRDSERRAATGELDNRNKQITATVEPIARDLETLRSQIEKLEQDRRRTEGTVTQMFTGVSQELGRLRLETGNLVDALKRPQVRGAWGEMQLRNVVRAANMTEHVDFDDQVTLASGGNPDAARLRPDMVIHLPSERQVVVDAKVPLDAYLAALEARDDDVRATELARHARQLRSHIDALGSKRYHENLAEPAEFTVCFVPNEAIFCAALDEDPALLEHGAARRVLVATPSTLLALLFACAYGWRQSSVERSAREIEEAARELHRRFGTFLDAFRRTGRALERSVGAYNEAVGSAEARLMPQLRRIEDAGAASAPEQLTAPAPIDRPARLPVEGLDAA